VTGDPSDADIEAYRKEITHRIRQHAAETACKLNPESRLVSVLVEALVKRKVKFGDYYCPCRAVRGDPEHDRPNICPCETHEEEIAQTGQCRCGLFVGEKKT